MPARWVGSVKLAVGDGLGRYHCDLSCEWCGQAGGVLCWECIGCKAACLLSRPAGQGIARGTRWQQWGMVQVKTQ